MKENIKKICFRLFDLLTFSLTFLYLPIIYILKKYEIHNFSLNLSSFLRFGIYPIKNHYYEPQFRFSKEFDAKKIRNLNINFKIEDQLNRINKLQFSEELSSFLHKKPDNNELKYYLQNGAFEEGDGDLYYLMIRNLKPRKIIEIGSGFSTLVSLEAIRRNKEEGHDTELICIEPFEIEWLNTINGIQLIRKRIEEIDSHFFITLDEGDFLFIDSSHIIRPENDVLFEYFEILPALKKGVIIHIHDIFTPRHYPNSWLTKEFRFWNEQYLLEAFLHYNNSFEILYSLNYLKNNYYKQTAAILKNITHECEPASFWLCKTA